MHKNYPLCAKYQQKLMIIEPALCGYDLPGVQYRRLVEGPLEWNPQAFHRA